MSAPKLLYLCTKGLHRDDFSTRERDLTEILGKGDRFALYEFVEEYVMGSPEYTAYKEPTPKKSTKAK